MIENSNKSAMPSNGAFIDTKKYIGVASVNILAINPNNAQLRKFGWSVAEDADEPVYVNKNDDGKVNNARVRFLVQIQELEDKPIIALDFFVRPDFHLNNDGTKCKVIDKYGRTAWATKEESKKKLIPTYSDGRKADIDKEYKLCHRGEEELLAFMMKYLNATPFQRFVVKNRATHEGEWVKNENPGTGCIANWDALCSGDVSELKEDLVRNPETANNIVKIILGVRTKEDNKSYQIFIPGGLKDHAYLSGGERVDVTSNEYLNAKKGIDRFLNGKQTAAQYQISASPVREWKLEADNVEETSPEDAFENGSSPSEDDDDLPMGF